MCAAARDAKTDIRPSEGDWPLISIVTPSYNQSAFLERTMRSVLDQGYPQLEYMVVDGGSTDGSVEIIRRFEGRLAWWSSEPDNGQSHAINKGLSKATGEVVGWLNSDDTLAPGALYRIGRVFAACRDVDLVYGNTNLIDADDRALSRNLAIQVAAFTLIRLNRNVWCQPGTMWRRSLHERIGLLDESLHFAMDCDFWIKAALKGKICFMPFHLANLRLHGATKSSTQAGEFIADLCEIDRRYGREYRNSLGRSAFRLLKAFRVVTSPFNLFYAMGIEPHWLFDAWLHWVESGVRVGLKR